MNEQQLVDAILKNDIDKVKEFINQGVNVNFIDSKYNLTPLIISTIHSNLEIVELLLRNNADVTTKVYGKNILDYVVKELHSSDKYKQILSLLLKYRLKDIEQLKIETANKTLLEYACYNKWIDIVELLIQHNIDVNIGKPLLFIFKNMNENVGEDITLLSLLLSAGANLKDIEKVVDKTGNSLLHIACQKKDESLIKLLINYGIDLNIVNSSGFTPLSFLCSSLGRFNNTYDKKTFSLVKLLINAGADINVGGALAEACSVGHVPCIKLLLKKGANINGIEYTNFENTHIFHKIPIVEASKLKHNKNIVELLIKHGADVNNGCPLSHACQTNNIEVVELLLQSGADVNTKDKDFSYTPLMFATINGNLDIIKLLIEHGADVNICDQYNETALILSTKHGYEHIVRFLFQHNADINTQSKRDGQTALFHLIRRNNDYSTETIEMFLQGGADVNIKDMEDKTPIFYVVKSGNLELFNLLLKYGADINVVSQGNKNLLYYALASLSYYVSDKSERIEIIKSLLKSGLTLTNNSKDDYFLLQKFLDYCESGDVEIVSLFIDSGINVNLNYNSKNALLTVLTKIVKSIEDNDKQKEQDYITIAKMLIQAGADIPPECKKNGFKSHKYNKERQILNKIYKIISSEKIFNKIQSDKNQSKKIMKI